MYCKIIRGSIFLTLMFAAFSVESTAGKVSGAIYHHQAMKKKPAGKSTSDHVSFLFSKGANSNNLSGEDCALYVDAPLSEVDKRELAAQGIVVHETYVPPLPPGHPQGFYLATVSYNSLAAVEADNRIARLASTEISSKPLNDVAQQVTNTDDVHAGTGVPSALDGTGVTIAVADSGLDTTHNDFPAPIEAFDMTDGTGPGTWGTDVSNTVTGHGTHVTGSALGRGTNSMGGTPSSRVFSGAAPGASLLFYKIGNDVNGGASSTDEIEAINRAGLMGADVFSMSYGGVGFFNDGSSGMCQAIDTQFAAGMVVCISAGNDGNANKHDEVVVAPSTTSAPFSLTVDGVANPTVGLEGVRLIWRDTATQYNPVATDIVLNCTNLGAGETLTKDFGQTSTRNTDSQDWTLDTNISGAIKVYNFTITNNGLAVVVATPTIHCYALSFGTWVSPDQSSTVMNPSVADNALCVGAWVHRNSWTAWSGGGFGFGQTLGGIATFSSRGPRIDNVQKPDFSSPGSAMISTRDTVAGLMSSGSLKIDDDGSNNSTGPATYYVQQGTSMACPFAAGMCALLIQENILATPTDVRNALINFASSSGAPNFDIGYGLIDIQASVNNVVPIEILGFDID
jgi:hypothetical protein